MATYTNKNGTDSNDILTYNSSSTVIYHAKKGNDTIKITGGKVTVYTDAGTNTITATGGSGHVINVAADAAASDKITSTENLTINGANAVSALLGSGKDTVELKTTNGKINGGLSQIRGGLWGDTFITNNGAQNYQLYGDAGDDIFTIKGGNNIVFWGGAAIDTFTVTGGTNIKVRGGDSADIYNIKAAKVDMQLGYGNDIVNVEAGDNQYIKANLGINTINLKAGKGHVIVSDIDQAASKKVGHDVGYGVDKVYITGTASEVTANLGDGKDIVEISGGTGHKIYTEGWGDTLTVNGGSVELLDAGEGDNIINIAGGEVSSIVSGAGKDVLTITDGAVYDVDLGDGNDSLEITGGMLDSALLGGGNDTAAIGVNYVYLNAGSGDDTVTLEKVDGCFIEGGAGKDTMTVTGGFENHVLGQEGDDILTIEDGRYNVLEGGAGNDTLTVNKGNGHVLIGGTGDDAYTVDWTNTYNIVIDNNTTGDQESDTLKINGLASKDAIIKQNDESGYLTIEDAKGKLLQINGWAENSMAGITFSDGVTKSGELINKTGETVTITKANQDYTGTKRIDTISLKGAATNNVYAGAGDDIISVTDSTGSYIFAQGGDDSITAKNVTNAYLVGDQGNDKLTASGTLNNVFLMGGDGNDTYDVDWYNAQKVVIGQSGASAADKDTLIIRNFSYNDLNNGNAKLVYDGINDQMAIYVQGNEEDAPITKSIYITNFAANALDSITFVYGSSIKKLTADELMTLAVKRNVLGQINPGTPSSYTLKEDEGGLSFSGFGWNVAVTGLQNNFALDFTAYRNEALAVRFSKTSDTDGVVELVKVAEDGSTTALGKITLANAENLNTLHVRRWNGDTYEYAAVDDAFTATNIVGVGTALTFAASTEATNIDLNNEADQVNISGNNNKLQGGIGDDVLQVSGDENTILGGAGNNDISVLSGTKNQVYLDDGDNIVNIACDGNSVYGTTSGTNTVFVTGNDNFVYMMSGTNSVIVEGDGNNISTSSEDDIISLQGSNNTVAAGQGNDVYEMMWQDGEAFTGNVIDNFSRTVDKDVLTISEIASDEVYFVYHDATGDMVIRDGVGNNLTIKGWNRNPLASISFEQDGVELTTQEINAKAQEASFTITKGGTYDGSYLDNINIIGVKDQIVMQNLASGAGINLREAITKHAVQYSWSGNDLLLEFFAIDVKGVLSADGSMLIKDAKPANSTAKYTCTVRGFYDGSNCNTVSLSMTADYTETYMFVLASDTKVVIDDSLNTKYVYGDYGSNNYGISKDDVVLAESRQSVIVTSTGNNGTINGSSFADTIAVYGSHTEVNALAGMDIIEVGGSYNHVSGGYGQDTYKLDWRRFTDKIHISERLGATSVDGTRNNVILENIKTDNLVMASKGDLLLLFDNTGKRVVVDGWTKSQAGTSIVNLAFTAEADSQGQISAYNYDQMKQLVDAQQNTTITSRNISSGGVYTTGYNCQNLSFSGSGYTAYITDFTNGLTTAQWDADNYKNLDFSAYADGKHSLKTSRDNYDLVFEVLDHANNDSVVAKIVMAEAYMLDGFYSYNTMKYNGSWTDELVTRAFEDSSASTQLLVAGK